MLSIGASRHNINVYGIKKPQNKDANSNKSSAPKTPSAANASANITPTNISGLEALAMNNILHNNMSAGIKEPAFAQMNSKINKSLDKEESNVANLSSALGSTKSSLDKIKSKITSGDATDEEKQIYQLIASALESKLTAFEDLLDKAKTASSQLSAIANFGISQVVKESENSSSLMEMLSKSSSEYSSDASTKLLKESSNSASATKKFGGLVQKGQISLKKVAQQAANEDPQKTAEGLDNLYRNTTLSKEDRLTVTQVLSNIAIDNPLNGAGKASAVALENIFKKDSGTVAKNAATGLRMAATAGNEQATDSLINVAVSPVAGKEKNMEAIMQLTKVAKAGCAQSTKATTALNKMAQSNNMPGDLKEQLIDSLSQIAYNGGENGQQSLDTLGMIAGDDKNPHNKSAFNAIMKNKSKNNLSNSKVVESFANIAESKRMDTKMKNQATEKLGEASQFGTQGTANNAQDSLTRISTDPTNKAAQQAQHQIQKLGFGNLTKANQGKIISFNAAKETKSPNNPFTKKDSKTNPKGNDDNVLSHFFGNNKNQSNIQGLFSIKKDEKSLNPFIAKDDSNKLKVAL